MTQSSKKTAKQRGPGKPFAKGESGNPGGRPKVALEVRELARTYGPRAITRLAELMDNPKSEPQTVIAAARALLDRGYGKPIQELEITPNKTRDARELSDDDLAAIVRGEMK